MTTELTTVPGESAQPPLAVNILGATVQAAEMLAKSTLIPGVFQKNPANCMIAIDMALRLQANPLMVMQNLFIIDGKPTWSAQFLIACINKSGLFKTPLRFELSGTGDDYGCIAWAVDKNDETLKSPRITIKMAKGEGWFNRKASKWQTMPEQMMKYRAASFFARTYCPEITMGLMTQDEVLDIEVVPPSSASQSVYSAPDEAVDTSTPALPPVASTPPTPPAPIFNPMWNGTAEFPPPEYDREAEIENVKRLVSEGYIDKTDLSAALKLYGAERISLLSSEAFESFVLEHVRLAEQIVDETTKRNIPRAKLNEFAQMDGEQSFFVSSMNTKRKMLDLIVDQPIPTIGKN